MGSDNVIHLNIPPAHFIERYQGYEIRYQYEPLTATWHWSFNKAVKTLSFEDHAVTRAAAIKAAHKMVDKIDK